MMKERARPTLDQLDVRRIQEALLKADYPSRRAAKKLFSHSKDVSEESWLVHGKVDFVRCDVE